MIDRNYRGNVFITMINHGNQPFLISKGDKICQIIVERCGDILLVEANLSETDRGDDCLGSTGLNVIEYHQQTANIDVSTTGENITEELDESFLAQLYE